MISHRLTQEEINIWNGPPSERKQLEQKLLDEYEQADIIRVMIGTVAVAYIPRLLEQPVIAEIPKDLPQIIIPKPEDCDCQNWPWPGNNKISNSHHPVCQWKERWEKIANNIPTKHIVDLNEGQKLREATIEEIKEASQHGDMIEIDEKNYMVV